MSNRFELLVLSNSSYQWESMGAHARVIPLSMHILQSDKAPHSTDQSNSHPRSTTRTSRRNQKDRVQGPNCLTTCYFQSDIWPADIGGKRHGRVPPSFVPNRAFDTCYHVTLNANWISRESVAVASIAPAPSCSVYSRFPEASVPGPKTVLLSSGDWKFALLRMLKNSTRNCVLKVSDIRLIPVFL